MDTDYDAAPSPGACPKRFAPVTMIDRGANGLLRADSPPWPAPAQDAKTPRNVAPRADEGPEKSPSSTEDARD